MMRICHCLGWLSLFLAGPVLAGEPATGAEPAKPVLAAYYPKPESKGGWRSLLPEKGSPSSEQKAKIRELANVDWDRLASAWELNSTPEGATGLLIIRRGYVIGEWYKDCDREKTFNIYSSSKAYTSLAFGLLLEESKAGKLPGGKKLDLETKVCTAEWIPEALSLPDPRKADITLRHLLNMLSGLGADAVPQEAPFEWSLGKVPGSPMATLKGAPGTVFNYSNAGVAHLVLLFNHAAGQDLFPYLKERLFDKIGMERVNWMKIGGNGNLGPYNQGYSGILTTAREHARFCYLALHKGQWAGQTVVPGGYYEFAWQGTKVKPEYGAQWWVYPKFPDAPKDLAQTAGAFNNHGYVVPSLDLVVVRVGDAKKFPAKFEQELVRRILAALD